jgi:hypothetical protein
VEVEEGVIVGVKVSDGRGVAVQNKPKKSGGSAGMITQASEINRTTRQKTKTFLQGRSPELWWENIPETFLP